MGEEEWLLEIRMSTGLQRDGSKNLKKEGRFPKAPGFGELGARDVRGRDPAPGSAALGPPHAQLAAV